MHLPRASRIWLPKDLELPVELWMGGADSLIGDDIEAVALRSAWLVDCALDMPAEHCEAAALFVTRVFSDIEERPASYERIDGLARALAARLLSGGDAVDGAAAGWLDSPIFPAPPPSHVFIMCTQGLNRSGLLMGRLLRALGLGGSEALAAIRGARAPALNNLTFARLVWED